MDERVVSNHDGAHRIPYYGHKSRNAQCVCGWSGRASRLERDLFDGGMSLDCPECFLSVCSVIWPDEMETREAAAAGDDEAVHKVWEYDNPDASVEERTARTMAWLEEKYPSPGKANTGRDFEEARGFRRYLSRISLRRRF